MVRPSGIEPPHTAPEAVALSTELQAYVLTNEKNYSIVKQKIQGAFWKKGGKRELIPVQYREGLDVDV